MANRHYGKIGDIWKHLPLAEILSNEKPDQYWESNAGSALYQLTRSEERDYGVFHFYEHSKESALLSSSKYYQTLDSFKKCDGFPSMYPGSTYIAMSTLGADIQHYLFCDIDPESLTDIKDAASTLNIPPEQLECINADGVTTLLNRLSSIPEESYSRIFVQMDPCGGYAGDTYYFDN